MAHSSEQKARVTTEGAGRNLSAVASLWRDDLGRVTVRALQGMILIAAIWLVSKILIQLKLVTLPLLIALIIASAMHPIIRLLRRYMNRIAAAAITLVGSIAILSGAISFIVTTVVNEMSGLTRKAQQGFSELVDILSSWGIPLAHSHLSQYADSLWKLAQTSSARASAIEGVTIVTSIMTGALLMIVFLFFFLLDGDKMWDFIVDFLPLSARVRVNAAGEASMHVLGRYIRGTVLIAAFAAVVDLIAMLITRVPLAFPLAAMIFLGAFVPIVGALTTGLAAALVALVAGGPAASLVLVCVVIVVNQIEHYVLQPKVMGSSLSLHGIVIIIALGIGAQQGGVAGALLAVPITAAVWSSFKVFRDMAGGDNAAAVGEIVDGVGAKVDLNEGATSAGSSPAHLGADAPDSGKAGR